MWNENCIPRHDETDNYLIDATLFNKKVHQLVSLCEMLWQLPPKQTDSIWLPVACSIMLPSANAPIRTTNCHTITKLLQKLYYVRFSPAKSWNVLANYHGNQWFGIGHWTELSKQKQVCQTSWPNNTKGWQVATENNNLMRRCDDGRTNWTTIWITGIEALKSSFPKLSAISKSV